MRTYIFARRPYSSTLAWALGGLLCVLASAAPPAKAQDTWRTVAAPVASGSAETLFFERDGPHLRGWRMDWRAATQQPLDLHWVQGVQDQRRFTAVVNRTGLWLVGASIGLLRPDGKRITASFDANEPLAVSLPDGSVLVFGKERGNDASRLRRLSMAADGGRIEVEELPAVPGAVPPGLAATRFGMAAVTLADGRVLVAGGYTAGRNAQVFNPATRRWSATGAMSHDRVFAALLALPDGRAVALGTGSASNERTSGYSAEIWDPKTSTWTRLPDLPLDYRVETYGAEGPTTVLMGDGSIAVAGGVHDAVLVLRAKSYGQWQPFWRVAGVIPQRIGGVVQAIGSNELVVSGGVFNPGTFGDCCAGRPWGSRLVVSADGALRASSLGMSFEEPALAQRGMRLFVAGGRSFRQTSSGQMQYSAVTEVLNLATGHVQQRAPLPAPIARGRAIWLDDDRVFIKAVVADNDRGVSPGENLSSHVAPGSGLMGVYTFSTDRWQIAVDPQLARAELIGLQGSEAVLVGPDAQVWRVNTRSLGISSLPRLARERTGGTGLALAAGRIVVAGGMVQAELVSLIDPACDGPQCADRYVGFGAPAQSRRHELFDPKTRTWQHSAPSRGAGPQAVVYADGRVAKLGHVRDPAFRPDPANGRPERLLLVVERAAADGRAWATLPRPMGLPEDPAPGNTPVCSESADCQLMLVNDPGEPQNQMLLFRHQKAAWRFDETIQSWVQLSLDGVRGITIIAPATSGSPPLKAMGLQHKTPAAWR